MARLFGNGRRGQMSNDARHAVRPRGSRAALGAARRRPEAPAYPRLAGSGMEPLESRLLMSAVRQDAAFATFNLGVGNDRSTTTVQSLGFASPINFFGSQFSGVFVNNNGNISLGARNSTFIDAGLDAMAARMLAPFYADVDTLSAGSTVRYGRGTVDGHAAFGVNWVNVDYFMSSPSHPYHNSFQLVLIDRSDLGAGNFDVEFNYDQVLWESGLNQSGNDTGLGGNSARIGFTAGDGVSLFEMLGSGHAGSFLDGNLSGGLIHGSFMSDVEGRYVFRFRDGTWADAPAGGTNTAPYVTLPDELVLAEGASGMTALPDNFTGVFTDPDADTWNVTADYGDGSGLFALNMTDAHTFLLSHTYTSAGNYLVTVTVDDGKGGVGTAAMPVGIYDVTAPVLDVAGPRSALEGDLVTLTAGFANDPDLNDVRTVEWVGDGVVSDDGLSFTFHATDNGTYAVQVIARDQWGNTTTMDVPVEVANVAPTASGFASTAPVDEGTGLTVNLTGGDDVSSADLAAGLLYSFDFDGDGVFDASGPSPSASHVYGQAGTYLVRGRVSDKDGGYSEYETSVVILPVNQAPTATLVVSGSPADEGGTVTVALENVSDAPADLAAGLTYSFDLDGDGVYELSGASGSASAMFGDNGTYAVNARVTDRYGAHSDYSAQVVVNNVAPVSSLLAPATGDEGSALVISLGPVTDPSAADVAAGFTYSFDFNNDGVYEVSGSNASVTHVFDDNGHYIVRARVTDKDGGSSDYSAEVHVKNVAPKSIRFWDNNPKAEGTLVTVGFDAVSDPSGADTAAGFTYSYDFDNDGVYEVTSRSATATHTFNDNGVFIVRGRVTDKDGGFEEYTTDVEVYNVAPTASFVVAGNAVEGSSMTFRLDGATDASSADLAAGLTYSFDLNNDGVYETSGASPMARRAFANEGSYTVRGKVTDKDGGSTEYTAVVNVANAAPVITSLTSSASTFGSARQGSTVRVNGMFTDAGVTDTHTAVIDWGDGTTSAASLSESGGTGMLTGSHVYAAGGIYTVTLRLKDNAAPAGTATGTVKSIITGVGLRNGVLEVVGTNGNDKVTLDENRGSLKVKSSLLSPDPTFLTSSVKEVQVWLGGGSDSFDTKGTITPPVYLNGAFYSGSWAARTAKPRLFSDILVAA